MSEKREDELGWASAFVVEDPELCYLDGNSLGRLPGVTAQRLEEVVGKEWGADLIRGWNNGWIDLPQRVGDQIADVVGAKPGEVVVADSTSVNLFKLATAAMRWQADSPKVVTDAANFPSDHYILESAIEAAGASDGRSSRFLQVVGQADQVVIEPEEIISHLDSDTALLCLSHVAFKSGQLYDMARITKAAHDVGALVLWDLSHSVGAVPIELAHCNVDLAVGCTYKYLCGGPGAPAFLYCRQDLQTQLLNPIAGWFSHKTPFEFDPSYSPAEGIERFLTGTPPILSLVAVEEGVQLVRKIGMENLRNRSIALSERLLAGLEPHWERLGLELRSPKDAEFRGSHISLGHSEAHRIAENLIQRHKVIPDFRKPDNLRLGIAPLYTREHEIDKAIRALVQTVAEREFEEVQLPETSVT